jgi:hypothetical protein
MLDIYNSQIASSSNQSFFVGFLIEVIKILSFKLGGTPAKKYNVCDPN